MKALVVANWKMNPGTWKEAKKLFEETKKATKKARGVTVVIVPPALYVRDIAGLAKGGKIALGVQHALDEATGAHTGDVSLFQAADSRASYAIVAHAERRALGMTNADAAMQVVAALALKMVPILCVGEKERSIMGEYFEVVKTQVTEGLAGVPQNKIGKLIIAYEPVWAIGAEHAMQPRDMHEMAIFIRKTIVAMHGDVGHDVTILYGGSVDSTNAPTMLDEGDVNGFLVGRASADIHKVKALIQSLA